MAFYGKRKRNGNGNGNGVNYKAKRHRLAPSTIENGFMGRELKFFDSSRAGRAITAPTDSTGGEADPTTLNCIFAPTQGTGEENRDGRRVLMKTIQINGQISCAAQTDVTATDNPPIIYIALVLDKQTNGAQLNSEDVFKNEAATADIAANPLRNLVFSTRFQVLAVRKLIVQNPNMAHDGTNIEQNGVQMQFNMFKRLNTKVEFTANNGTVADIQDNSLHLITYATNIGLVPAITYQARTRFVG